jgi:hypothetical protein
MASARACVQTEVENMKASKTVGKAAVERLASDRASAPRASVAAVAVGGAVAVVVYRALRN